MCVCVSVPGVYKRERDICDCMDKGKQERECMERKWLDTFCKISKRYDSGQKDEKCFHVMREI